MLILGVRIQEFMKNPHNAALCEKMVETFNTHPARKNLPRKDPRRVLQLFVENNDITEAQVAAQIGQDSDILWTNPVQCE